jgi:squalene synthase HpnC
MSQARSENFPVATRLLPRRIRAHLLALYGCARLVADGGPAAAGDRLALLDELESDLRRVWHGTPEHPLLLRLQPTVAAFELPIDPFLRLIAANRRDQVQERYETYEDLLGYCALSANPVGELVLALFGAATPERIRLSDAVCSGLQLVEHWQDIAEDYGRGRIYIPGADRRRFGVREEDLGEPLATPAVRRLVAFEVHRARALLDAGAPLVRTLRGRAAFAVAAFIAGGRAALDAIERADHDVLAQRPRATTALRASRLFFVLVGRGRR